MTDGVLATDKLCGVSVAVVGVDETDVAAAVTRRGMGCGYIGREYTCDRAICHCVDGQVLVFAGVDLATC